MYLVDTNVVSEAAPARSSAHAALVEWMDRHAGILYLSTITVAEIEAGIAKARRQGAGARARSFARWLDQLLHIYGERVLPLDIPTARTAGNLSEFMRSKGVAPGFGDVVIAATAQHHSLTVLTRNLRHFTPMMVPALDPFVTLPPSK